MSIPTIITIPVRTICKIVDRVLADATADLTTFKTSGSTHGIPFVNGKIAAAERIQQELQQLVDRTTTNDIDDNESHERTITPKHPWQWIGVDLDGTLAEHYWPHDGLYDPLRIGDPIAPMVERVQALLAAGWNVRVFTARVGPHGSAPAHVLPDGENVTLIHRRITEWTTTHIGRPLLATCIKDYGMVALYDDCALHTPRNTGRACCTCALP